ncbi:kinesin-like protein KIN-13B isoform X1 [Apium graveolens]|uniref:kinesin-like protein KIN-13B isoform X1 n=2 Tax=Apium graveolens TaxID=4045 RepID=UPI003D790AD8
MQAVGRQMQRSGSTSYHQRQLSDNFLEPGGGFNKNNKWLQSQDSGLYGYNGGAQGPKFSKNVQKGGITSGGGNQSSLTSPSMPRSSSMRLYGSSGLMSPNANSPGLFDLSSFDTELLSEDLPVPGKCFDDPHLQLFAKHTNDSRGMPESNLQKSSSAEKERTSNVAKIKVVVRKRPLNKKEVSKTEEDIIAIESNTNSISVHEKKFKVDLTEYVERHEFFYDAVLNENVSNEEVYSQTVEPIIPILFERTKATCFAYGQTGSGKTYTMQPLPLKASQDIFRLMHYNYRNQGYQLFVSFFEIYGGKLFDLLNDRKKLCMREDGKQQVCIVGLQEFGVSDVDTIKELIERGNATRSTGTTGANEESSRSHAILQLAIKKTVDGKESKPARLVGKLSFIDLAGSERGADTTDNDKQTRMEGAEINKSLLALKECIRALDNDQGHIPFRGSKLTEVLRDSFAGDSRTVMISCISPNSGSCEHTLNTLRYADRVKSLSKGTSSFRKDTLSSSLNIRSSTALPLSSVSTSASGSSDSPIEVVNVSNRFGWPKKSEIEPTESFAFERVPNGQVESSSTSQVFQVKVVEDYYEPDEETREQDNRFQTRNSTQTNAKNTTTSEARKTNSDEEDDAILKEENDLVNAHRKLIEETMNIVREEMNLLVQVENPGNQLDEYIHKLNAILSHKAAGVVQLQNQLSQFRSHLHEYNILASSGH